MEKEVNCEDVQATLTEHDHLLALKKVKEGMPEDELLSDLADLFKIFGDSTRIKILYSLFEADLCVCEISELLCMTQSAISHQLRILKDSKLISCKRDGKAIIYYLADDHVRSIIAQGYEHITEPKSYV